VLLAAEREKAAEKAQTAALEVSTGWVKMEETTGSDGECVICEEKKADTALVECGHMLFCGDCAGKLKECPVCRQKVVKCIRIYQ